MADEQENPPSATASMPRVRRRAPTIELKATEVAVDPPASAAADTPEPENASPPEYPTQPPDYNVGGTAPPYEPPPSHDVPPDGLGGFMRRPLVEAGLAGGLVALVVFVVLWLAGTFTSSDSTSVQRVAELEARLRELASRPAPTSPDQRALDALNARVGQLENAAARAGNNSTAASDEAMKSIQANVANLARRVDDNAAAVREARGQADAALKAANATDVAAERKDLEALSNRVTALEQSSKALVDDVAKSVAAAGDRPLRAVVATQALQAAVERGEPFTAELTAVRALNNPQAVAPLEPFAASGLPSPAVLARQLAELAAAMPKASASPPTGGFLDRLQANAEKLVRIRPIDESAGDDPAAVIGRAQARAARADLAGAVAELKALPADVRAPAEEWIKKVEARTNAVNASRRLVADALSALGKTSP